MSLVFPRSILVAGLLFLSSCQTPVKLPIFSGDHPTGQVRQMWSICYLTQQRNQPFIQPQVHVQICDCMIDLSREKYKSADYRDIDQKVLTDFFSGLSAKCTLISNPSSAHQTQ